MAIQIVRHFHRNSDYFLLERGEKSTGLINMPSPTRGGLDDCFREHQIHRSIPSFAPWYWLLKKVIPSSSLMISVTRKLIINQRIINLSNTFLPYFWWYNPNLVEGWTQPMLKLNTALIWTRDPSSNMRTAWWNARKHVLSVVKQAPSFNCGILWVNDSHIWGENAWYQPVAINMGRYQS